MSCRMGEWTRWKPTSRWASLSTRASTTFPLKFSKASEQRKFACCRIIRTRSDNWNRLAFGLSSGFRASRAFRRFLAPTCERKSVRWDTCFRDCRAVLAVSGRTHDAHHSAECTLPDHTSSSFRSVHGFEEAQPHDRGARADQPEGSQQVHGIRQATRRQDSSRGPWKTDRAVLAVDALEERRLVDPGAELQPRCRRSPD